MKSKKTVLSHSTRALFKALLLGLVACNRQVKAQSVLAPTPATPDSTPTAMQSTSEMDVFAAPAPETLSQPFKWGAFTLRPHPFYQFLYADGLQATAGQLANSTIQQISIGALLQMGDHWTLDYTPLWSIYSNNQFQDTFGQTARLAGGTAYKDWILGFSQSYADTAAPSAETGTQLRQQEYNTAVNGAYTMNSKMSLDLALNQDILSADQFSSYREWSTMDWLNYQFWPRLNAALGAGGGYTDNSSSPDSTFERLQGRVNWRATDKISFQVHGGMEVRQFLSGGVAPFIDPIYDALIQYQPFAQTKIFLSGSQSVSSSILQNQITETAALNAGVNQRLLGKVFLNVNGGYQNVKYLPTSNATTASRGRDKIYSLNTQLSYTFLKRGSFAVFYQISRDDSSQPGFSFTSHQVGAQIGFNY